MVNKNTIVAMISIAVIAGSLTYSSLGAVSASGLEFRWNKAGSFDLVALLANGNLAVCNDSTLPANFDKYSVSITYDGNNIGTFVADGGVLAPHTIGTIHGNLESADKSVSQYFFYHLDSEMGGMDARISPEKMSVQSTIDAKILGIIPYDVSRAYSGEDFFNMMNGKTSCDE